MKRIVIVGAGGRGLDMFARRIQRNYRDKLELVGVCDPNPVRCAYMRDNVNPDMKIYGDFDRMLSELKPDAVIVTTVDRYHAEYIVRALEWGCEVFSEKPLAINEEQCRAIREAEKRTGRTVHVTFNCRFMPYFVRLKELLREGVIGRPLAIHYEYTLIPVHGGDYFKRWHRFLDNCGGMMVHKATHHFDIVNWLLEDEPKTVSAQGARLYFGDESRAYGERCSECSYGEKCPAYEALRGKPEADGLYFNAEKEDGYIRDHCSFKGDTDIYDSMSVSVQYCKGTMLTYSLNLFSTNEGYTLNVIGENGRIETSTFFPGNEYLIIVRHRDGTTEEIRFPKAGGSHNGGDDRMLDMLFGGLTDDPLGQCSGSFDGVKSAMIGIAANRSIKDGCRVDLTPILDTMR